MSAIKKKMVSDWAQLTEEVSLPQDIATAISTGRVEFLKLAERPMNAEEVGRVLNLVRVLMETNQALKEHSMELAQKLDSIYGNFRGLQNSIIGAKDFALFREEPVEIDEDQ